MWWKFLLTGVVSFIAGAGAMLYTIYLVESAVMGDRERTLPTRWSAAGKDWPKFANWLRYGGRRDLERAAFSAMRDGLSEAEVRSILGPPDAVLVGKDELRGTGMEFQDAGGAYAYKLGPKAEDDEILQNMFAVIFNAQGKVRYRFAFGVRDGSGLAAIDEDTRSERLIMH